MEKVKKNPSVIQEELGALVEEMRMLRQKVKLANLYHYQMEELDKLKMEFAFMTAKILIYQKRSKRSQAKQWKFYKKQIGEII